MSPRRWTLSVLLVAVALEPAAAQFGPGVVVGGVPVLVPNGIGFRYRGRHLQVAGYFGSGYGVGVVPVVGYPYGPVLPPPVAYFPPTYGVVENRITVNVIAPPPLFERRPIFPGPDVDLSGVDLDLVRPPWLKEEDRPLPPPVRKPARPPLGPKKVPAPAPAAKKPDPPRKPERPAPDLAAPRKDPVEEQRRLVDLGIDAFRAGDYGLAAFRFRQAIAQDRTVARPHFLLGQSLLALGRYRQAYGALETGLRLRKDWPGVAFRPRADLYAGLDADWKVHLDRLRKTLAGDPADPVLLFLEGYLAWFDGDRPAASALFRRARALSPDPFAIDLFLKAA